MTKRVVLVSAVLVAALVAAVLGATAALSMIGRGTFGPGRPLSEADVRRSYAAMPKRPPTTPSPGGTSGQAGTSTASPHPSGGAGSKVKTRSDVFRSAGGTVFASCTGGQARLTSWIPATGYIVDGALQGPTGSAWVKFKSGSSEITVTVSCQGGLPRFSRAADDRGGGGGGGDDGGGSGRSRGAAGAAAAATESWPRHGGSRQGRCYPGMSSPAVTGTRTVLPGGASGQAQAGS
jgi:hypothetical protein